jgi:hypothetical protein
MMSIDTRLHYALKRLAEEDEILGMIAVYAYSVRSKDAHGDLPIHTAIKYHYNDIVILTLLEAFPRCNIAKDMNGHLPLNLAIRRQSSEKVIKALFLTNPQVTKIPENDGNTSLHLLSCRRDISYELYQKIFKANPQASLIKNQQDELPIHHLCNYHPDPNKLNLILSNYSMASTMRDKNGYLPLHCFLMSQTWTRHPDRFIPSLKILLDSYPSTVYMLYNPKNERTAIDLAFEEGCSRSTLNLLFDAEPTKIKDQDINWLKDMNWNARKPMIRVAYSFSNVFKIEDLKKPVVVPEERIKVSKDEIKIDRLVSIIKKISSNDNDENILLRSDILQRIILFL